MKNIIMKSMSPRQRTDSTLYFSLMAFFLEKPYYGYELYKYLRSESSFFQIWYLKQSQFYGFLDRLLKEGFLSQQLVEGDQYPDRKLFTITGAGISQLGNWVEIPVKRGRDMRQEFFVKLFVAKNFLPEKINNLINLQKIECANWVEEQNNLLIKEEDQFQKILIKYRKIQITGMITWLSEMDQE